MKTITCSDGSLPSLHFPDDEVSKLHYERFKEEEKNLYCRYYGYLRAFHGVFASNQNKYVESVDKLNSFDQESVQDEKLYAEWLAKQPY